MINKLKILGEYLSEYKTEENSLNINDSLDKANVIVLDYELKEDNCKFIGIDILQYDKTKAECLLLLKDIKGNKVSDFPTVFIDSKGIEKSLNKLNRILKSAVIINPALNPLIFLFNKDLNNWIQSNTVKEEQDLFETTTDNYLNEISYYLSADDKNLCTIRINGHYVGDSAFFKTIKANHIMT
jgi:hypothetical protein